MSIFQAILILMGQINQDKAHLTLSARTGFSVLLLRYFTSLPLRYSIVMVSRLKIVYHAFGG